MTQLDAPRSHPSENTGTASRSAQTARHNPLRKIAMGFAIAGCLVMSVIGGLLPIFQGWIFFIIALYLLATEFVAGRRCVIWARHRWPKLSTYIHAAADHRWAPRHLREFDELTDPTRQRAV